MKNSLLIPLLKTLSNKELRECRQWVHSPAHNTRPEVSALYDYLVQHADETHLEQETVWSVIAPTRDFNVNLFRQIVHALLKGVEDFLVYQRFQQDAVRGQIYLLQELRERHLEKHFEKRLRETQEQQSEARYRNSRYLQNQYLLEMEQFTFAENKTRTAPLNLQAISDTLDIQYIAHRLRDECAFFSRQTVYKSNYQSKLLDPILEKVAEYGWQEIPAIGIYYYCYLALSSKTNSDQYFQRLIDCLQSAPQYLPNNEVRDGYLVAINYIIKRINSGDPQAVRQAFTLYREGIEQKYLINNDVLSQWTYRNAVICGTRLGEFEWTEAFIHQYNPLLERKYRQSMQQECLSRLYYARKDYQKAMQLLIQVEFKDILQNLTAKTMLAKIYYELDEWEALDSLLVSMKAYLRRKRVIGYHQENYGNIIRLMQKMLSVNLFDKKMKQQLIEEVQQTNPLTEKNWMLEQLG